MNRPCCRRRYVKSDQVPFRIQQVQAHTSSRPSLQSWNPPVYKPLGVSSRPLSYSRPGTNTPNPHGVRKKRACNRAQMASWSSGVRGCTSATTVGITAEAGKNKWCSKQGRAELRVAKRTCSCPHAQRRCVLFAVGATRAPWGGGAPLLPTLATSTRHRDHRYSYHHSPHHNNDHQ